LVLIPPEDLWEPIQRIRRLHDPNVKRWMPHVTLLYPFVPHDDLADAADKVARVALGHRPFEIELARFTSFSHSSGKVTLWLEPAPREPIDRLEADLQAEFPNCDDVLHFRGGFVPHLSVGFFVERSASRIVRDEVERTWAALAYTQAHVSVIARSGLEREPFKVVASLPLGG
jgi:2'-5' RNA ligase